MAIRLNRAIALSGLCSRRAADLLIEQGRVEVNGQEPMGPGMRVCDADCIKVDNKKIQLRCEHYYFVLNKPTGYVCSKRRLFPLQKIIYDIINLPGLFTVGRLDKDTSGLIILTTDGLVSQTIIHPSSAIEKEYVVRVEKMNRASLELVRKGVFIQGVLVVPKLVEMVGPNQCKVIVMEGKNREIRRLFEQAGLTLISLQRVRIGQLSLNGLKYGGYKQVKKEQLLQFFGGQKSMTSSI